MSYQYRERGPYTEYGPAHERALVLQRNGSRSILIKKRKGRWWITHHAPQASKGEGVSG